MKTEIKTILAPTDFTTRSDNALIVAAKMAQRHHAKLIITHVIYTYYLIDKGGKQVIGSNTLDESTERALSKLAKLKTSFEKKYDVEIETSVSSQNLVDTINDYVHSDQIDLVIVGTSGKQNMKQFFLGSNSYNILLYSDCSVLLVPENFKRTSFKKILFPVRVTHELLQKAELSILLAKKNDGEIKLLGVGKPEPKIKMRKAFSEIQKNLHLRSTNYKSEFKISDDCAATISEVANNKKTDIIILADQDEDSWKSFMGDNFFKKMINGTDIPLLIVKSKLKRINNKTERITNYDLTMPIPG